MFTRLKNRTSEASPPTDGYQHQLRDTNSINKAHSFDITSDCNSDGLDWFHSITPPLLPDDVALPIITSTQENLNRKPNSSSSEMSAGTEQPNCQTGRDILSNTDLILNNDVVSNHFGTITSASEEENQRSEKNENIKGRSSITQEEMMHSERQKEKRHPESLGCVFQKVSKSLRDRRLRELELNHQQRDKEGGGGREERVVSGDGASKNVTTSESHTSSTVSSNKNCLSKNLGQDNLCSGKQSRFAKEDKIEIKNISAAQREKITTEAETSKELHAKLSDFMFKPRKMRPIHNHNLNASSDISTEFQTGSNPGSRGLHTCTENRSQHKPVSCNDSAGPLTDTKKKKRQDQYQSFSGSGSRRKQVSCASEVENSRSEASICFTSEELDKGAFPSGEDEVTCRKTVGIMKERDYTESLCKQQRTRVNTGDETKVSSFTCIPPLKPNTSITDPAPSKSGCTKSTVASSASAKLSRFSFTCRTEPMSTAQTKEEKNPPTGVEKSPLKRDHAECLRGNSKDNEPVNSPDHSLLGKKTKTEVIMGKVKDKLHHPTATEFTPGQKHEQGTESPTKAMSECKGNVTKPIYTANLNSVKMVNAGPVHYQNTVSQKKRKCFELRPPPTSVGVSKGPFSGLSLFGSVDLSNDVLDTDWDQEVSKKAKI